MQFSINKAKATAIIVTILMMTSIAAIALPAQAQTTYKNMQDGKGIRLPTGVTPDVSLKTYPSLAFSPNPIGVGQALLVNLWINPPFSNHRYGTGYTVTITKPDGTKDTVVKDSYNGDSTAWFEFAVDQVGTWKIKFDFPGQYFPAGNYTSGQQLGFSSYGVVSSFPKSCYYEPSTTGDQELVVQQDQVMSYPPSALPTDYWTRPISPVNREWKVIAGNWPWPYANNYQYGGPNVIAPNTAHIVWKRQGAISGLVGADVPGVAHGQGSITSGGGTPSLIYAGRCYQTVTKPVVGSVAQCYDLRTGEVYYEIPTSAGGVTPTVLSYYTGATILPAVSGDIADLGPTAHLMSIGARIMEVDPWTGAVTRNVTGMTGTFYNDPYVLSVQTLGTGANTQYRLINWTAENMRKGSTAVGDDTNFTAKIVSNITYPFSSLGTCDFNAGKAVTAQTIMDNATGVVGTGGANGPAMSTRLIGTSLITGQVLWNVTTDDVTYSGSTAVADNGKYCFAVRDSLGGRLDAWDLTTGKLAWQGEELGYPWGFGGAYAVASAYGLVYRFSYAGIYAIDWATGKITWNFTAPATPFEAPWYPSESFDSGAKVADGKIYVANSEHSATQPIARDWKLWALNATTGTELWNITGSWGDPGPIADGYLTASNSYDGYMYVFGKGKSATTVTAEPAVIANGATVLIKGTVTDQSPAQPGTPCVSKDSMETQMEYLHMQKPIAGIWGNETITGVPVTLVAVDASGTAIDLGSVTTNGYFGTFSKAWTPPKEGTYEIMAYFHSDDSYGSSKASTAVSVGPAPEPITFPEQPTPADYTWTIVGMGIAIIIAVALVGALILMKRK